MKLISFNPAHKHLFSEDFITGFNEGAKRQYEATQEQIRECPFCHVKGWTIDMNFCPDCGADMRETE